jgi:hypothetical protein
MMDLRAKFGLAFGLGALLLANGAAAQDSLEQGKSAAQLFASDCAVCHKSPQGLAKGGGLFGVQNFLRQHYTTSKETAAAIAGYLEAMDRAAGPAPRGASPKRAARGDATGKPAAKKQDTKPGEAKQDKGSQQAQPSEPKASESKPPETKPVEPKAESKPSDSKPAEAPKPEKAE